MFGLFEIANSRSAAYVVLHRSKLVESVFELEQIAFRAQFRITRATTFTKCFAGTGILVARPGSAVSRVGISVLVFDQNMMILL